MILIIKLGSLFFFLILISVAAFNFKNKILILETSKATLKNQLSKSEKELNSLKNQNQYKINQKLKEEIDGIHSLYKEASSSYEKITDLKSMKLDTVKINELYALVLKDLSDLKYSEAKNKISTLNIEIQKSLPPPPVPSVTVKNEINSSAVKNNAPTGGYNRQQVQTSKGVFTVDIISADLNTTRVIVDTASDSDCSNNCPVLPLGDYINRNGAFAGINGTYFCPAEYPSCAGKTNSFDTLLMNKNKKYFNSDNNVYSVVPAVIFKDNWVRFVGRSLEWGRDTSVDSVIAMQPLLIFDKKIVYSGSDNSKYNSRGYRSFIGNKENFVFIGVIHGATMSEGSEVLNALGLDNALNLDEGGSTNLWYNSYIIGPNRSIPNAVLLIRK